MLASLRKFAEHPTILIAVLSSYMEFPTPRNRFNREDRDVELGICSNISRRKLMKTYYG